MSSKVILLKYVARFCDATKVGQYLQLGLHCDKTAVILKRTKNHSISIQGYPEVPISEKHKAWLLFQQAVKDLLGIPKDTSICIRFSESPYNAVGSLSIIFTEPRYLIDLVVHPIKNLSNSTECKISFTNSTDQIDFGAFPISRDPYYAFNERCCKSCNSSPLERRRAKTQRDACKKDDMNLLYSQLAELSVCLQRTQLECDAIAERCGAEEKKITRRSCSFRKDRRADKTPKKVQYSVSFSSSVSSESGKGSMAESDLQEDDMDGFTASLSPPQPSSQDTVEEAESLVEEGDEDERIENILKVAESLAHQFQSSRGSPSVSRCSPISTHLREQRKKLPDIPTCINVRPSFRYGGAYVMWNPVSLDGEDRNGGYRITGYEVHVDYKLYCLVEGALSSQVEIEGMVDGTEYSIQVCTIGEEVKSHKTSPVIHKHHETNRPPYDHNRVSLLQPPLIEIPTSPAATPPSTHISPGLTSSQLPSHSSSDCKVAKVHTWLKHKSLSECGEEVTGQSHAHAPARDTTALHVHFEDEGEVCSCGDDTKSISSSHTSGIVMDYLVSPKLVPSCSCPQCCSGELLDVAKTKLQASTTVSRELERNEHQLDLSCTGVGIVKPNSTCSSSGLTYKRSVRRSSCENGDTVIDHPLYFGTETEGHCLKPYSCAHGNGLQSGGTPTGGRSEHSRGDGYLLGANNNSLLATYV